MNQPAIASEESKVLEPLLKPTEIFRCIKNEEELCKTLPKRKGFLKAQIVRHSDAQAELKQVYCYLRNKQMKLFQDDAMMHMEGIIDFDLVQTVLTLDAEMKFDSRI